jgi:hypothetical protein
MPKKKSQESSPQGNPTPWLGLPRPDRKSFSYSENQLLDQITTEIVHAWAKDLKIIKEHFNMLLYSSDELKNITNLMENKFPALNEFLASDHFVSVYHDTKTKMERIDLYFAEINKRIFDLENRIQFPYVRELEQSIKSLSEKVDSLLESKKKNSVWTRIFHCKKRI